MDYASSILGFLPGGRRSTGISQLLDKLEAYLSPAQVERVREAYEYGAEKHHGQWRVSGEPYITHPVAVADILADLRLDADTLVAAILHDVIEDTPTAKAEIASIFGQVVAELVDGVSKLDQIQFKNRQEAQAESFRKMLLAMVRDIRVIMVKLAETFKNTLKKAEIAGEVEGREKHLYSIYKKMQNKKISLNEMVDVYGFRIIVDSADTCYRTLGLVHGVYKPMPGRFKDYIAIPRVNGYQSLHTTLFGPNGIPIEVQIRSEQMHRVAESGIAAHWKYKSGGDTFGGVEHDRAREWLASLVQIQEGGSSEEFLESVKVDLFPDKVYVFTPKGKILRLPTGATTVDFAYAIHTDVGNRCVAAKVDRRLVPLRTPLRNGQTVEIITAKGATPNPSWSSFLVTAKARAAIRAYLKNLKRGEALELGRRLLGLALEEFSLNLKKIPAADIDAVVKELNLKDAEELYEKIGLGERLAPLVARRLQPTRDGGEHTGVHSGPLRVAGTEGLLVTYARCCFPIPNDPIMAYLSAGRGVMIHRQNCGNLAEYRKQPEKWLSVAWEATQGRTFSCEIQLEINNRVGVLAAVASSIAGTETNIDQVSLEERDVGSSSLKFQLQVRDRRHLAQVIKTIRRMPDVQRVFRTLA